MAAEGAFDDTELDTMRSVGDDHMEGDRQQGTKNDPSQPKVFVPGSGWTEIPQGETIRHCRNQTSKSMMAVTSSSNRPDPAHQPCSAKLAGQHSAWRAPHHKQQAVQQDQVQCGSWSLLRPAWGSACFLIIIYLCSRA